MILDHLFNDQICETDLLKYTVVSFNVMLIYAEQMTKAEGKSSI